MEARPQSQERFKALRLAIFTPLSTNKYDGSRRERPLKKVTVMRLPHPMKWVSMRTLSQAVAKSWNATQFFGVEVQFADIGSAIFFEPCDAIVVPALTPETLAGAYELRVHQKIKSPFIFHLCGEGSVGGLTFERWVPHLHSHDHFIAPSRAGQNAFHLSFPKAQVAVIPYAPTSTSSGFIADFSVQKRPDLSYDDLHWVYAGRLSDQKNIHTLMQAFALSAAKTLQIFGKPDGLGSPNMGLRSNTTLRSLKKLALELKIAQRVTWNGFQTPQVIATFMRRNPCIFVSCSLHSDDEFGLAAHEALCAGTPALLSHWGGHLELARRFPEQVQLIPVHPSPTGPFIDPAEMSALGKTQFLHTPPATDKTFWETAELLSKLLSSLVKTRRSPLKNLKASRYFSALQTQSRKLRNKRFPRQLFQSYSDPKAVPIFKAYGMKKSPRKRDAIPHLVPWAEVTSSHIRIRDPHRGFLTQILNNKNRQNKDLEIILLSGAKIRISKTQAKWLWDRGYLFCPETSRRKKQCEKTRS